MASWRMKTRELLDSAVRASVLRTRGEWLELLDQETKEQQEHREIGQVNVEWCQRPAGPDNSRYQI